MLGNNVTSMTRIEPGIDSSPLFEVINEPEGSVLIAADGEPCFDTSNLSGTGAGWTDAGLAMRDILRFINQEGWQLSLVLGQILGPKFQTSTF